MPSIQGAYNWIVSKCNSPNVGYSQQYRSEQTVNGITYYDCSSLIFYALKHNGFNLSGYPFTTATMGDILTSLGFTRLASNNWQNGDIVWRNGHCEMVYQGNTTMGAHTDGVPLAQQVSINSFTSNYSDYTYVYRYSDFDLEWIARSGSLTQSEMENNAMIVINTYRGMGYPDEVIAALLGNFQNESGINPLREEVGGGGGFGIIQWTPKQALIDNMNTVGLSPYTDGDNQTKLITLELQPSSGVLSWYTTEGFISPYYSSGATSAMIGVTGEQFLHNTKGFSVQDLTTLYMIGRERPSYDPNTNHIAKRKADALTWLEFMGDMPTPTPTSKRKRLPIYMMLRRRY